MNSKIKPWFYEIIKIFILWFTLAFAFPIALSQVFNAPADKTLLLILSTFALEYFAVPAGIGLGLNYVFVLIASTSVAVSVVFLMFGIFDVSGVKSKKVSGFLSNAQAKARKSKFIEKYGIYGLAPGAVILGFYICPGIAWVLGWRKDHSAIMIISGFVFMSVIMALASIGVSGFLNLKPE